MKSDEIMPVADIAKYYGTTHRIVVLMMLNGTLPIGPAVAPETDGGHYVARPMRSRWEAYKRGEL